MKQSKTFSVFPQTRKRTFPEPGKALSHIYVLEPGRTLLFAKLFEFIWLNVYAAYDLNASRPCSALDVILVCGDGNEFAFRYPLAKQEQAALLEKMDAYCREQTGMALADFRARYLVEEPQPRQAPSLAQL